MAGYKRHWLLWPLKTGPKVAMISEVQETIEQHKHCITIKVTFKGSHERHIAAMAGNSVMYKM